MSPRCRFAKKKRPPASICSEPFRVLFPIGLLASVIGVLLWPLVYAGWLGFYPGEAHARIMVQGFVGGFAIGFLGTAFPRMIGSPSLTRWELSYLVVTLAGCVISHSFNFLAAGDWFFLLLWIGAITVFGARLAFFRDSLPPPGFALAGMGILAGITGTILLLVGRIVLLSDFQRAFAALLLNEAFILGPILGVGGFLFPRFFNVTSEENNRAWNQRAAGYFYIGLALLATFVAQAAGSSIIAPLARTAIVGAVFLTQLPILQRGGGTGTLSLLLRLAILLLIIGIATTLVAPGARVAARHTLFVGGYGMLILAVASRVTWGHSGNIDLAEGKRTSLRWIIGLLLFALATRVVAGFIPTIRVSHHIYAALLWVIAVVVWSCAALKYVRVADPEDD